MLTFEQIKELIQLVADRDLGHVRLERSGFLLEIDAQKETALPVQVAAPAAPATPAAPSPPAAEAAPAAAPEPSEPEPPAAEATDEGDHQVTSPIVGTFYRAPAPDADPFVKEGDRVEVGQVVCIVEAMKMMNEIEADAAGTVVRVHPENAQAVEYGQPLFSIKTG